MTGPEKRRDPIGELIRFGGRRPDVDTSRAGRVRAVVEARWRARVRCVRMRRLAWAAIPIATAAAIALMGSGIDWPDLTDRDRVTFAVHLQQGVVRFDGGRLATGADGRIAVQVGRGPEVRLDRNTRFVLVSESVAELERGAIYVDTASGESLDFEVVTPFGRVHHDGTQFEARLTSRTVVVRVREGAVAFQGRNDVSRVEAGYALVAGVAGRSTTTPIERHGASWSWVESIAPPIEIEGATLLVFLQWVAREAGLELAFVDPTGARVAREIILHGTIDGLTPREALTAVVATTQLEARVSDDALEVW